MAAPNAVPAKYRLYGLTLESPIPLPYPCSHKCKADVRLRQGDSAQFAAARRELQGDTGRKSWFVHQRLADGMRFLRWSASFEFMVSADGHEILFHQMNGATTESLTTYLLGHVLSFSLIRFGFEPLHGTVLDINGRAIAFLGDCGYGKSTLAAAFITRGFPVLTDDLMVLERQNDGWMIHPGLPRLKLFPSAAGRVLGHRTPGRAMNRQTAKLVIPLQTHQAVSRPVPLNAVYALPAPGRRSARAGQIRIETLSGSDAFLEVVRAAFNLTVTDKSRLANQFSFAERLSASVPVRRLSYRRSFATLPAVCDAILADVVASDAPPLAMAAAKRKVPHGSSATI